MSELSTFFAHIARLNGKPFEEKSSSVYTVARLVDQTSPGGPSAAGVAPTTASTGAWIHGTVNCNWYIWGYTAECKVWVTDDAGKPRKLATLRAHLTYEVPPGVHKRVYPDITEEAHDASEVRAMFSESGFPFPVPNFTACGYASLEDPRLGTHTFPRKCCS